MCNSLSAQHCSRVAGVGANHFRGRDDAHSGGASDRVGDVSVGAHREAGNARHAALAVFVGGVLLEFFLDHRRLHEFVHSDECFFESVFVVAVFVALELDEFFDEVVSDPLGDLITSMTVEDSEY